MSRYYVTVGRWLGEHVPRVYARVVDVATPYVTLMWVSVQEGTVYVLDVTAPYRQWIVEQLVVYLQWVSQVYFCSRSCGFVMLFGRRAFTL